MVESLCAPALIFLILTTIQIFIDIFKAYYSQAFFKFIGMILITLLLNILCKKGLGIIAWMLVFIPFILMTLISIILVIVFGINPAEGDYTVDVVSDNTTSDTTSDTTSNTTSDTTPNTTSDTTSTTQDRGNKYDKNELSYKIDYNKDKIRNTTIVKDINIDIYESNKGMFNYSPYTTSTYKRRINNSNENNQPTELENSSISSFYKNMYNKIL